MNNNVIYMTYKKEVPQFVLDRLINLNPNYTIDFNLDDDCINFLKENFNDNITNLFKKIKKGMYKADLWRLCRLYKHPPIIKGDEGGKGVILKI